MRPQDTTRRETLGCTRPRTHRRQTGDSPGGMPLGHHGLAGRTRLLTPERHLARISSRISRVLALLVQTLFLQGPFITFKGVGYTMAIKVRPLHDRIIVQRLEEEDEQQVGGIIIPDTAKEKPQQGKVIAVGKGKVKEDGGILPMDVKDGDTILFGKYSGQEIKLDGDDYLIMREDEVLGVVQ